MRTMLQRIRCSSLSCEEHPSQFSEMLLRIKTPCWPVQGLCYWSPSLAASTSGRGGSLAVSGGTHTRIGTVQGL